MNNIPNILSSLRIILTPLFILLFIKEFLLLATVIFTIAIVTDFYDGYYARKFNNVSKLGKFLDPLADKILVISAFTMLYFFNLVDFLVLAIIIVRDVAVTTLRLYLEFNGKTLRTTFLGKWKTFSQFIFIYAALIAYSLRLVSLKLVSFNCGGYLYFFSYLVALITFLSGILYFYNNIEGGYFVYNYIATVGFIGYSPYAPGTLGSLAGLIFFFFLPAKYKAGLYFVITILTLLTLGGICSHKVSMIDGVKDPSKIVIDEVVGMWISICMIPHDVSHYIIAFIIFRFFDIVKPFPINKLEDIYGGIGIMIDDIIAGFVTLVFMQVISFFW